MTPDLIVTNADIRTMDPGRPRAAALAARDGRVLALGPTAEVLALAGPGTRRIDAGGRLVLPGFLDAHCHLADGGRALVGSAQLHDVRSVPELQDRLAAHAGRHRGAVVWGGGWQPGLFDEGNLTREVLDAAVPGRPAMIHDSSFHSACLNSAALAAVGLDDGADPPGGRVGRDAAGRPTGMLHEGAALWAERRLPPVTEDEILDGARAGLAHANRHGITGIIDPKVTAPLAAAWGRLVAERAMTLRVSGAAHVPPDEAPEDAAARLAELRAAHPAGDFMVNAAKLFLDGVFENRTAAMLAPFAGGGNASIMFDAATLGRHAALLDGLRFQLHFHCIGDAATRAALDAVEAARRANGPWPSLPQVAHLQVVDPADLPRFAALGATANIQPLWARLDPVVPDIALDLIGADRRPLTYAFRRLLDAGSAFCLSSDFPVSTLNPFEIIETAITRQARLTDGPGEPFLPAEALTVAECVAGYTVHAAAALWRGHECGRLAPGLSADLILLDRDVAAVPPHEIGDASVLLTLFRGAEVWRAPAFDG